MYDMQMLHSNKIKIMLHLQNCVLMAWLMDNEEHALFTLWHGFYAAALKTQQIIGFFSLNGAKHYCDAIFSVEFALESV